MAQFYYDPAGGGFYLDTVNADSIPTTAIAITDAQHTALLAGLNSGQVVVMVDGVPTLTPKVAPAPTKVQLIAYAERLRAKIAGGGLSVNIAAPAASALMVEVGTGTAGLAFLANAVQLTSTTPGVAYDWDQSEPVTLTGAQVLAIQAAVGLFQQQLFTQKTAIRAAVNAGTISTTAQIDDPTTAGLPAWPANS